MSEPDRAPSRPLAERLAAVVDGTADIEIGRTSVGMTVRVTPHRAGARQIDWIDLGDDIIVQVGDVGGRWELDADDLDFLEDLVMSVIAGRVSEVVAYRRSRVAVTLRDGSVVTETGYDGLIACLPLPLWPRWSPTKQYLPYR